MSVWLDQKEQVISNYRKGRLRLIEEMGGRCECCGCNDASKLEFHHLQPRSWVASKANRWTRLARYRKENEDGVLELLCGTCNKRAGVPYDGDDSF